MHRFRQPETALFPTSCFAGKNKTMNMINHNTRGSRTFPWIHNRAAFSLIELLVALSILAVVAAIIVPRFLNVRQSAQDTAAAHTVVEVNNLYNQWVALGGTVGTGTGANVIDFLCRVGSTTSATRANLVTTSNPVRDATGSFGSGNIQIGGAGTCSSIASGLPLAGTADGFVVLTGGTGLWWKQGNAYWPITFNASNSPAFTIGTRVDL